MNELLETFTSHLKAVLTRALCLAVEEGGDTIAPTHLLWALGTEEGCIGAEILRKAGATPASLRRLVFLDEAGLPDDAIMRASKITPLLSEESKAMIEKAVHAAGVHGHRYVGTEHLLHGIVEAKTSEIATYLVTDGISETVIRDNLATVFQTTANFPETLENAKGVRAAVKQTDDKKPCEDCGHVHADDEHGEEKDSALGYFTTELTDKEIADAIDPVIGRDEEIDRVVAILARRTKNNPLLLGEPGVGKTAIAEGLAKRILEGTVPDAVLRLHVHRLDMSALVAGTMYRGDFEARVTQLLDELQERDDVVLFIDEIHTIIGAGAASGSLDAANMLKPALARGELRCIGATTSAEYKKHIMVDAALERRFATVTVREPSANETLSVLKGIKHRYEKHHTVLYPDAVLETIVRIADRYMTSKQFPDKAIDLLDEAGAHANVGRKPADRRALKIRALETELERIRESKSSAVTNERFPDAVAFKEKETKLQCEIDELKAAPITHPVITITNDMILAVASKTTGVPLARLNADDHESLRSLDERLQRHVVAQDSAVSIVANAMRRAKLGFAKPNHPLASFLFAGPSGVGKTALAKALALEMFGDAKALIRFDMSEFAEGFSVSKLVGAPAGYVGYREGAKLSDALRDRPHAVILFDELEKAHKDVQALLLQILDEGSITDATGAKVNFQQSVVIMTTNAGQDRLQKKNLGFHEAQNSTSQIHDDLRAVFEEQFRPELVNRIGHICVFNPLKSDDIIAITKLAIDDMIARLKTAKLSVTLPKKLAETLAKHVKTSHGARDIHRVLEERLEHTIANAILATKRPKSHLNVTIEKDGNIKVR
ncbi:MAG: ATP-dependent Clp protease ATP-binding subunit [Patescibacteria group bacterium]